MSKPVRVETVSSNAATLLPAHEEPVEIAQR
jgi:hypothetical protein